MLTNKVVFILPSALTIPGWRVIPVIFLNS
jgi:hypothetical protein